MRKNEYLKQLWNSEKEWNYNLNIAYVFKNLTQNTNPIIRAMKKSADLILEADEIKKIDYEVELEDITFKESLEDKIQRANKKLKYGVNGYNTRAYHYVDCKKEYDETNNHLFMTLFRQCLLDDVPTVLNDIYYAHTLCFIESGCNGLKNK